MMTAKRRPLVGDECWFVEWCYELAFNECGDVERDLCKMRTRRAETKEEAERIAREVYPQTLNTFGVVDYWPSQFVAYDEADAARYPHAGFWEATAEAESYDGE